MDELIRKYRGSLIAVASGGTRRAAASRALLGIALAGSAIAVGSVHTATLCIVAALLAVASALAWSDGSIEGVRAPATALLFTGLVLTGYTALQCVPIPMSWLAAIASRNADVWSRALVPLHEAGPRWAPISLDPVATKVEVLKGITYVLAFTTALRVARTSAGTTFLNTVIVGTGIVLALAALLHPMFGAKRLFGIYEPTNTVMARHIAPLMNPNNLASYLNVSLCVALAAALARQPRLPRSLMIATVLLLGATQVWIASRGGVVMMVCGAALVLATSRLHSLTERGRAMTLLSVATVAAAVFGGMLIIVGSSDEASKELLDPDVSKFAVVKQALRMAVAMPLFGCGRGAFASSFPAFRTEPGHVTYASPENFCVAWVVEWGVPVGLLAVGLVSYALRPREFVVRPAGAGGTWVGLLTLGTQNLGDLGSEIPGVALLGVVCAAIVVGGTPSGPRRGSRPLWTHRRRLIVWTSVVLPAVAIPVVVRGSGTELYQEQRALENLAIDGHAGLTEAHARARMAMLRHPGEPYLPFAMAMRAYRTRDDNPLPWIGATLERASIYGPAHMLLARVLAARSPSQARLEYRTAMEQEPLLVVPIMPEALAVIGGYSTAMELVPSGAIGVPVLQTLSQAVQPNLPATSVMLDRELLGRAPETPGALSRQAHDAVDDLEAGDAAPWCTESRRLRCIEDAREKISRLEQVQPDRCDAYALGARLRAANGDPEGALADIDKAADAVVDRVSCLEQEALLAKTVVGAARENAVLARIATSGCTENLECAHNFIWIAQQHEMSGNARTALAEYQRALSFAPDDDALLEHVATIAAQLGLHAEAAEDYEQLARKHPSDLRWPRQRDAQRGLAIRTPTDP